MDTHSANVAVLPKGRRRLQFRLRSLLLAASVLCLLFALMGRKSDVTRRDEAAEPQRQIIRDEISSLPNHRWAGEYYEGDGLGVNVSLMLAPKSGFVFELRGCMGLYDVNQGQITDRFGALELAFRFPNQRKIFAQQLVPIAWGARRYLIASDKMIEFCNAVNAGQEPRDRRHGFYLLRRGDEAKQANGSPDVPDEFKCYLLSNPIEAQLIEVKERRGKQTRVRLNRGENDGLLSGMELHLVDTDGLAIQSAKVTVSEPEACEAEMTRILDREATPRVGWTLSTKSQLYSDSK